jgi:hypothetical protein
MGTRFFWLPWGGRRDGVAGSSRWLSSPLADSPHAELYPSDRRSAFDSFYYLASLGSRSIPVYAVTTNPDLVPLRTQTLPGGVVIGPSEGVPYYEPFYCNNYANTCAYIAPGWPIETVNSDGPFGGWQYSGLFAYFVYEMMGTTSIAGASFSQAGACADNYIPFWVRTRRVGGTSTYNYLGIQTRAHWDQFGMGPALVYVVRPSTGAIVGFLAQSYINGGYGPCSTTDNEVPQNLPGTEKLVVASAGSGCYHWVGDVTGIQDHDLLVWEWWFQARRSIGGAPASYYGANYSAAAAAASHICGGLSGQPLTRDGGTGMPDWAPSHGTSLDIYGIEPSPPRPSDVSVGF